MQWIANALEDSITVEEDFSHQNDSFDNQTQDNSFDNQTQLEPYLSPEETPVFPAKTAISLEETELLPVQPRPGVAAQTRRSPLIKALAIGLLVLISLLTSTSVYAMERPHIPGGSASIRITFDSQPLRKTYTTTVTVGSTDPTLNPIGARRISITTPTKSLTVLATGRQQEPATYASGVLQLGNGSSNSPIPVGNYDILSNSGVDIEFFVSSPIPPNHSPYIPAQAINPGPGGNITKYNVYGWYNFPHAFIFAMNAHPFSGGHNGYTVTVVSQTDIDSATRQLKSALSADQAELKSRLASSEQLLDPTDIQCQPSVKANRNPNDQASDVTVTGVMTCSAIAYTPAKLQAYGTNLLEKEAYAQWSGSYILIGQVQEKLYGVLELGKTRLLLPGCPGSLRFPVKLRRAGASRQSDCRSNPGQRSGFALTASGRGARSAYRCRGASARPCLLHRRISISRSCKGRGKSGKHSCSSAQRRAPQARRWALLQGQSFPCYTSRSDLIQSESLKKAFTSSIILRNMERSAMRIDTLCHFKAFVAQNHCYWIGKQKIGSKKLPTVSGKGSCLEMKKPPPKRLVRLYWFCWFCKCKTGFFYIINIGLLNFFELFHGKFTTHKLSGRYPQIALSLIC